MTASHMTRTLVAVAMIMACMSCAPQEPQTRVQRIDLGKHLVEAGSATVSASVELVNETTSDLKVQNVATSCGCLSATLSPELVRVGERGTLEVEMALSNSGRQSQQVTVLYT